MPTASIISRNGWTSDLSLFGHHAPIECSSFNPRLFKLKNGEVTAICAVGSQDCGLSVWLSGKPKSLVVAKNLFDQGILDICWSADGFHLFACSFDGTVKGLHFSQDDLGERISDVELVYICVLH